MGSPSTARRRKRTAVLISGRGSNMRALIKAASDPDYPAEIVLVLSNRPEAAGLEVARQAKIPTAIVDHKSFEKREAFEDELHTTLKDRDVEIVCLAGFMRILTRDFVGRWRDRMINIHPSLLPAFKGLDTHARALEAGVRFTGCTVHFVRPETDAGPIIIQAVVPVRQTDTPETLAARVLEAEHRIFPQALALVAAGRAQVADMRVKIDGAFEPAGLLVNPEYDEGI